MAAVGFASVVDVIMEYAREDLNKVLYADKLAFNQ